MPLRWGDPRFGYDPEEDAGGPRPFQLGDNRTHRPRMLHPLMQPKDYPKQQKLQRLPGYERPKFYTLPHEDKVLKRQKQETGFTTRRLTAAEAKRFDKYMVGPLWGTHYYVDLVRGKVGAGLYRFYAAKPGSTTPGSFVRLPEYLQNEQVWTPDEEQKAARYFWRYNRSYYWKTFIPYVKKMRATIEDQARRAYDDWVAQEKNRRSQYRADYQAARTKYLTQNRIRRW